MWILPTNHPLYSLHVQESGALNEDLKKLSELFELHVMWRSKPSSSKTWLRRWKRIKYVQRLFGRTLKRSQLKSFEIELIGYWEAILVRHSHWQESAAVVPTLDTFGRIMNESSKQYDLFSSSLKMSMITLASDSTKFTRAYDQWVTMLRQEYTQRKKQALYMRDNDYSSSLFTTHVATDLNRNTKYKQGGTALSLQAKWPTILAKEKPQNQEAYLIRKKRNKKWNSGGPGPNLSSIAMWLTPRASANENRTTKATPSQQQKTHGKYLSSEAMKWNTNWLTPTVRDQKGDTKKQIAKGPRTAGGCRLPGQVDLESLNRHGNIHASFPERLNPAWVLQLMMGRDFPFEKIFYAHLATWSFPIQQK